MGSVKSSKPERAKGESRLSLLQGLAILAIIGIVAAVFFNYLAG